VSPAGGSLVVSDLRKSSEVILCPVTAMEDANLISVSRLKGAFPCHRFNN